MDSKYLFESMKLDEMAMYEMSVQRPATIEKTHIKYSNKYKISEVKKLATLALNHALQNDGNNKYAKLLKSLPDILLTDFETDFDSYLNAMSDEEKDLLGGADSVKLELVKHYVKYSDIFKALGVRCMNILNTDANDNEYVRELMHNALKGTTTLYDGIDNYLQEKSGERIQDVIK